MLEITGPTTALPRDETRGGGIWSSNAQESAKVLCTIGGVGDVNTETDGAKEKGSKKERPT